MDMSSTTDRTVPTRPIGIHPVIAHWQGLRRGRDVPARTDLDPAALQPWLGRAAIIERTAGGRVRFRLAGRTISDLMGVEARGMPFRAIFAIGARDRLHEIAEQVFTGPNLLSMTLVATAVSPQIRPVLVPMALMPLRDEAGAISRALLCLDHDPRTEIERPCRFHIRQAQLSALAPGPRLTGVHVNRGGPPALRMIEGGRS